MHCLILWVDIANSANCWTSFVQNHLFMMSLDKSSLKILDFVFKLMAKKLVSILVNVLPVSEKVVICQLTNHQYRLFCCKRLSICYFLYGSSWNDAVILNAYIFLTLFFVPMVLTHWCWEFLNLQDFYPYVYWLKFKLLKKRNQTIFYFK